MVQAVAICSDGNSIKAEIVPLAKTVAGYALTFSFTNTRAPSTYTMDINPYARTPKMIAAE